jgi:excisionase family DNA binding protein
MSDPTDQKRFFDYSGAAVYTSLSQQTLRRFVSRGLLTPHRPGDRKVLFDRSQLDSLVLGRRAGTEATVSGGTEPG